MKVDKKKKPIRIAPSLPHHILRKATTKNTELGLPSALEYHIYTRAPQAK